MKRAFMRYRSAAFMLAGVVVLFVAALVFVSPVHAGVLDTYENISYALAPSAQKAYIYGERHFDAQNPADYDVNRAYYFFELAAKQDPSLPYVYHELARISFLRGNFTAAMEQINYQISMHGDSTPNSYYVRALIEGYMGDYTDSAKDYAYFLQFDPHDWAGLNDYAWVLLKANRPQEAVDVTLEGLTYFPSNPWLLNSNAIGLYEIGDLKDAKTQAQKAIAAGNELTAAAWLHAYPGNDPSVAAQGIASFQSAAAENMHMITLAIASSTVQSK